MLLKDAMKLGVLSGGMTKILESALVKLRVCRNRSNIPRARHLEPNSDRGESFGTGNVSPPLVKLVMSSI